jgi:hypothetical protein
MVWLKTSTKIIITILFIFTLMAAREELLEMIVIIATIMVTSVLFCLPPFFSTRGSN